MADVPQPLGPFAASERLRAAQTIAGTTRHYQGPGLGTPPPWDCPSCGRQWSTDPSDGCAVCIAEFRKTAEEIVSKPQFVTGMKIEPAAPTNENARRAVSPLVESRGLSGDRLADAIAEKVVERLQQLAQQDVGTLQGGTLLPPPAGLYAILVGLQLIAQAVADGAEDPLLPPVEAIHQLIRDVEALPTLQAYLIDPASAEPRPIPEPAPIPEEPEA